MRLYEGATRQNYQEALRSIGAILDQRGMREITLVETDDGFLIQGLAPSAGGEAPLSEPGTQLAKETFYLREDDIARFMDEAVARRQERSTRPAGPVDLVGFYEKALRVVGGYVDQQQPRDVFLFEQDHQFVMRLLMPTRAGLRHLLVEFTRDEIDAMIAKAQQGRQ